MLILRYRKVWVVCRRWRRKFSEDESVYEPREEEAVTKDALM
jgi:hypothetical protein